VLTISLSLAPLKPLSVSFSLIWPFFRGEKQNPIFSFSSFEPVFICGFCGFL
jgi:hypothetical protein